MCCNTITRCVECDKLIDGILTPCTQHTTVFIDNEPYGYCPATNSLDGYPINPGTGQPFNTSQILPLGGGCYRHPLQQLGALCVWCHSHLPDNEFNGIRADIYNRCSNVATIGFDSDGNLLSQDSNYRWEMRTYVGANYAFWRHKDTFNVEKVAPSTERQKADMPPMELLTPGWQFAFNEPDVLAKAHLRPRSVEAFWAQQLQECPLHKKLAFLEPVPRSPTDEGYRTRSVSSSASQVPAMTTNGEVDNAVPPTFDDKSVPALDDTEFDADDWDKFIDFGAN